VTRGPQNPERPVHAARQRVFGDERSGFRLAHENGRAGVLQRADAVQDEIVQEDPCPGPARQRKTAKTKTRRREDLYALAAVRRIGNDEGARRLDAEGGRIDDASWLGANLHDFPGAGSVFVDAVHGVRAPIEHEVLPRGGLLKTDWIAEPAGNACGNGADRTDDIAGPGGQRRGG
jgi:hypothetical protein